MKVAALPRLQKSQYLLMGPYRIRKHNGFLRLVACELLVNSKETFKQNRKRVLSLWRHKHEKKVQVMVWYCGPHQTFILPVFSVLAVYYGSTATTNNLWKWRTTRIRMYALGHLEQCVLNARGKDRYEPAKYGLI